MKAIVIRKYGPPEDIQVEEVAIPEPKDNEVLVKVHATAINDYDWCMAIGKPYLYRLLFGIIKPKNPIPGMELAGTIEAIGANVTNFQQGDAVYGDISQYGFGSFAEYLCIDEKALGHKPEGMSFVDATSLPHAAMLAVQGLIDEGQIQNDWQILINGAGGGVGTLGLQIAKLYGAEVTGVDTGEKLNMMKSTGFDHIIDYKRENFTRNGKRYDLILDAKTTRSPFAYLRSLKPHGKYLTVGGYLTSIMKMSFLNLFVSKLSGKRLKMVALKSNKDLEYINKLYLGGKIKPVIDGPYGLEDIPHQIQVFGEGKHKGKIVISLVDDLSS